MLLGLFLAVFPAGKGVRAEGGPHRTKTVTVHYREHNWWLVRWSDNRMVCDLYVDHEGKPTPNEVYHQCTAEAYEDWLATTSCPAAEKGQEEGCGGTYFQYVGSQSKKKAVLINLPKPAAKIDLVDCERQRGSDVCTRLPKLHIVGEEPLPNEKILQIQGRLNDIPFVCDGRECLVPLRPTDLKGVPVEFWAVSSFGDSSEHYQGRVRVADSGISIASEPSGWHVSLMSDRYHSEEKVTGCASTWEAFPPLGASPVWLENPVQLQLLETNSPYTFLAGQLIKVGYVDAGDCDNGGLLASGYASTCGLNKARVLVSRWQNDIDPYIIKTSQDTGIPSQLLKRVFAQESQFWPGTLDYTYKEYGLGQLTELGADTTLLWNQEFYREFCPLVLSESTCQKGYALLGEEEQIMLRGAFLSKIEMQLPESGDALDPEQLQSSIDLFSQSLLANCAQAGHILERETNQIPGEVATFEDLWRFTLVNYHAGSGCLAGAVQEVLAAGKSLSWQHVSAALDASCPNAVTYVEKVTQSSSGLP